MECARSSANDVTTDPVQPVDFVLTLLASTLLAATALPIGMAVALLHVLSTLLRNVPTCAMLAVGCVFFTSAVLITSAAYALVWIGLLGVRAALALKCAIEDAAKLGTNMGSLFVDEFAREKRKQLYERWGIRT